MTPELEAIAHLLWREYGVPDRIWKRPGWKEMTLEEKAKVVDIAIATSDALYGWWSVEVSRALRKLGFMGERRDEYEDKAQNEVLSKVIAAVDEIAEKGG